MHGAVVAPCFFDITNLAVLLDFLNEYEVQRGYLMGGEPLLHPDFNLIYSVLYDNGFQVALTTNGSLISDAIVELFKSKPPAILWISIYGFSKTEYLDVTNTDSYERVFSNIDKLSNSGISTYYKLIVTNKIKNVNLLLDFLKNHDTAFFYCFFMPTLNGKISPLKVQMPYDDIIKLYNSAGRQFKERLLPTHCNIPDTGLVVQPQGIVRPCIPFPFHTEGNLFYCDNFRTVLDESRALHEKYCVYTEECEYCEQRSVCSCPINIRLFGKDKKMRCEMTKLFTHEYKFNCEDL